ncbi:hypothetical protein [Pseudidiomarina insulisalsae]|uniref:hypothetical protein n=1 Tax=Pseudidiomarina insulisalsae TaxID=575789 RepID=UPI001300383A|nr:hypothetical protein [Pseudidiomarina insulisalsae]
MVALTLLLIVTVPVTTDGHTLMQWLGDLVQGWMTVFNAIWSHFLLHPWAY